MMLMNKCENCKQKSRKENAAGAIEGSINLKKEEVQLTLKFTDMFVDEHMGTRDLDEIEDTLLMVTNTDFVYSSVDMELIEIRKHDLENTEKEQREKRIDEELTEVAQKESEEKGSEGVE